MPILFKALFVGSAFTVMAGTMSADDTFTATFEYTPSASVEKTYASFQKTAKRACQVNHLEAGGIAMKLKVETMCREQLIDDAVQATQSDGLIAYHNQLTTPTQSARRYAKLR